MPRDLVLRPSEQHREMHAWACITWTPIPDFLLSNYDGSQARFAFFTNHRAQFFSYIPKSCIMLLCLSIKMKGCSGSSVNQGRFTLSKVGAEASFARLYSL